jgi:hypothetical protein
MSAFGAMMIGLALLPSAAPLAESLGVSASVGTSVGAGTFVASRFADAPFYASTLVLSPSLALSDHLNLRLTVSGTYEWTRWVTPCRPAWGPRTTGAPTVDCSDSDEGNARRWDLGDPGLTLSHAQLASFAGVVLGGRAELTLPASRASRATGLLGGLGAGLEAQRSFGRVSIWADLGLRKFLVGSEANALDAADVEDARIPITRCASFRRTDCVLLSGFVASWMTSASLGLRVNLTDTLSTGLSLAYAYTRSFGSGGDARSAVRSDVNGERVVDGLNEADTTAGDVDVSWTPRDDLTLVLGVGSVQPARTADGKRLRFPFWDWVSPANNFSALSFEVRLTR